MTSDVLVLNKGFLAIHTMSWQNALSLVYQGHAEAVDQDYRTYNFDDWHELSKVMHAHPGGFVQTVNARIAVPDVIRLTRYEDYPEDKVKFTRRNIYEHYKHKCSYCGHKFPTSNLNLDHVIPRSKGGKTTWDNIVLSCIPCNMVKGSRTLAEAKMRLLVKPGRPEPRGHINTLLRLPFKMKVSWRRFIDKRYWDGDIQED